MNPFVIVFRQLSPLDEATQQRRAAETAPWAQLQNSRGHRLDARMLSSERVCLGADRTAPDGPPVSALLFLEAADIHEAARIAESHPAVRYGAAVEVHAWTPPARSRP